MLHSWYCFIVQSLPHEERGNGNCGIADVVGSTPLNDELSRLAVNYCVTKIRFYLKITYVMCAFNEYVAKILRY